MEKWHLNDKYMCFFLHKVGSIMMSYVSFHCRSYILTILKQNSNQGDVVHVTLFRMYENYSKCKTFQLKRHHKVGYKNTYKILSEDKFEVDRVPRQLLHLKLKEHAHPCY